MASVACSLVSTVLNDVEGVREMLADLCAQTRLPDEFVVVDGGSKDGTYELLLAEAPRLPFKLRALQEKGCNVSRGRNLAIEAASHDVILTTDFGCRLDKGWVEGLVRPFEADPTVEIVTGSWRIRPEDVHTDAQWAEWALAGGKMEMVATPTCLASTRSLALKKQVWIDFGRYPEDLSLAGDDAIFSLWMVAAKKRIAAAPDAWCYWHRFEKLRSYLREARRNFRGAGEAIFFLNYGIKTGALFVLEMLSVLALVATLVALPFGLSPWWAAGAAVAFAVLWAKRFAKWARAIGYLRRVGKGEHWAMVPRLELGVRYNGVLGYWQGFFHGRTHCRACRAKMATLKVPRW
jgi:glycosyltransferase involved in cell wall biosynthesis